MLQDIPSHILQYMKSTEVNHQYCPAGNCQFVASPVAAVSSSLQPCTFIYNHSSSVAQDMLKRVARHDAVCSGKRLLIHWKSGTLNLA